MAYQSKKTARDLVEFCKHPHGGLSRRDFIARGMATSFMSVALHKAVIGDLMSKANAAGVCPAPVTNPGAIAQIFAEGGPTMGARFISDDQAGKMNATMATNYGVTSQANMVKIGPNLNVDQTSAFGFTILQGPPGYPGGPTAWKTEVLAKCSGGAHLGQFNADDGGGDGQGLVGGVGTMKPSQMSKDLSINVSHLRAPWAAGLPSAKLSKSPTSAALGATFSIVPAAGTFTNADALDAASTAATQLQDAMNPVFSISQRKGANELNVSANCAFSGNKQLADPNYGLNLFTPSKIAEFTSAATKVQVGQLSNQEAALLASYFQSAKGIAGGVMMQFGGRDYHGSGVQNTANADVEEARAIVMFLAGCQAANARGAMIYTANGQAIASSSTTGGAGPANVTINGTAQTVNGPNAAGDAGGAYNAGLILFYDPKGSPPAARFTGTTDANGNAKLSSNIPSVNEAMAGLFLSAHAFINNGTVPAKALAAIQATGVAKNFSQVMVF